MYDNLPENHDEDVKKKQKEWGPRELLNIVLK